MHKNSKMSQQELMKYRRKWMWETRPHRCHFCDFYFRSAHEATIDHLTPRSRGGWDDPSNLVFACLKCNQDKSDMTEDEYLRKRIKYVEQYEQLDMGEINKCLTKPKWIRKARRRRKASCGKRR